MAVATPTIRPLMSTLSLRTSANESAEGANHRRSVSYPSENTGLPTIQDMLEENAWMEDETRPHSVPISTFGASRWRLPRTPILHLSRPGTVSARSGSDRNSETPRVQTPRRSNDFADEGIQRPSDQDALLQGAGSEFSSGGAFTAELEHALSLSLDEDDEALRFVREQELAIQISIAETSGAAGGVASGAQEDDFDLPTYEEEKDLEADGYATQTNPSFQSLRRFRDRRSSQVEASGSSSSPGRDISLLSEEEQTRILLQRSLVEQ